MQRKPPSVTTPTDAAILARELVQDDKALGRFLESQGSTLSLEDARSALLAHLEEGGSTIDDRAEPIRKRRGYAARDTRATLATLYADLQRMAPPAVGLFGRPNDAVAVWTRVGEPAHLHFVDARLETALELFATSAVPGRVRPRATPPSSSDVSRGMSARGFAMTPAQARSARALFLQMASADRCTFSRIQSFERKVASARFVTTWEVDPATGQRTRPLECRLEMRRPYRRRGEISPEAEAALESNYRPSPCERHLLELVHAADARGEDGTALLERFLDWTGPRCQRCGFATPGARKGQRFGSPACRQAAHADAEAAKNGTVSDASERISQ